MTPDDITTLFAAADDAFPAIVGQPEDHQLHALIELLTPLLLEIPYDSEKGTHNLVGLIQKETDYVTATFYQLCCSSLFKALKLGRKVLINAN